MKEIPLTQGKVAIVDDDDFEWLSKWKWYYNQGYAVRTEDIPGKQKTVLMHAQIMGTPKGMQTDHRDMNTLNNCKANLRICTFSENKFNCNKQSNNTSGYKGVTWDKRNKKWYAQIEFQKKNIGIGHFDNPQEAAKMYDKFAKQYHGDFAKTNFEEDALC